MGPTTGRTAIELAFVALLITVLATRNSAAVNCKLRSGSPCICDLDDGSGYLDMTPLSKPSGGPSFKDFPAAPSHPHWVYSYDPCNTYTEGACKDNVAICQNIGGSQAVCGRLSDTSFTIVSTSPFKGVIKYGSGDKFPFPHERSAYINFTCDQNTERAIKTTGEVSQGVYLFTLTSKYLCPKAEPPTQPGGTTTKPQRMRNKPHVSLGTIISIGVLVVALLYVAIGTAFMYVKKGARGKEALPNYEFWIGFPGLLKDGVLFIVGKFRGSSRSSYDAI